MSVSNRYLTWPPNEQGFVGYDFSPVIPPGVALANATLTIVTNTNPPLPQTDFTQQPVTIISRQCWCSIAGGAEGTDYQLRFTASDTAGHVWNRTATMLCAEHS